MKFACFLLPVTLIGLCGCGPHSSFSLNPLPLPTDWKNASHFPVASPAKDLSRWWNRFDDPTLSRIISQSLQNSPDMVSAAARIRESRARRNSAAASLFPSLSGDASANSRTTKRDGTANASDTSYSAGLNASWEVDLFGKNRSTVEAASARLGASEENFHSVQAALASEIAIAYTNLRVDEASLEVLHSTVKSREETNQLASWRTQSGEADSLESSQSLSSLEQARAAVPALEQAIAQGKNLLTLLAGQAPGALDGMLASGKQAIPNPARSLAVGIPADTLRQRPDVRIAGYQLLAAAASTRAADAERYPSLNLSGSLGLNSLSSGKLFNPQTATAGVIAGISSPIFDAGRIRADIEAASAVEEQAWQAYRATVLTALSEVEDSLIACRRTTERMETLEKAAAAAREADQLARQSYQAGITDILTVLDSQRSLLGLEDSLFNIRADRAIAFIQLYKALGGGWSAGS
ncbi:MAG TPA: efflux transporter outer membrane subunit [Luteolibacter sp.]